MGNIDARGYVWLSYYSISGHLRLQTNLSYKYPEVYCLEQWRYSDWPPIGKVHCPSRRFNLQPFCSGDL